MPNFKELLDTTFWFSQPSIVLSVADKIVGYKSAIQILVGGGLLIWAVFIKNPVNKKLVSKFANWAFSIGLLGLFWFGLRYENTPIFAERWWFGLVTLIGVIWLIFILKYLFTGFRTDKKEFSNRLVKEKYLPKKK